MAALRLYLRILTYMDNMDGRAPGVCARLGPNGYRSRP